MFFKIQFVTILWRILSCLFRFYQHNDNRMIQEIILDLLNFKYTLGGLKINISSLLFLTISKYTLLWSAEK